MTKNKYHGPGNKGIELSHPEEDQRNPQKNYSNPEESKPQEKYPGAKEKFRELRKMLENK